MKKFGGAKTKHAVTITASSTVSIWIFVWNVTVSIIHNWFPITVQSTTKSISKYFQQQTEKTYLYIDQFPF